MHYDILIGMSSRRVGRNIPESKRKKQQIAVRLTDSEMEKLTRLSEKEELPIAYFVREGIQLILKRYSRKR